MNITVCILAKIVISGLIVLLLRRYMEFVTPSVEDHTRPAYTTCSHSYKALYHGDMPCPFCMESCEVSCNYSKCSKLYYKFYILYAENYSWFCLYRRRCLLLYAMPYNLLLCLERYIKILIYKY